MSDTEPRFLRVFLDGATSRDVVGYMVCRKRPSGMPEFACDHVSMSEVRFYGPGFSYAMHCQWGGSIIVRVIVGDVEEARSFVYALAGKYAVDAIPCTERHIREAL